MKCLHFPNIIVLAHLQCSTDHSSVVLAKLERLQDK